MLWFGGKPLDPDNVNIVEHAIALHSAAQLAPAVPVLHARTTNSKKLAKPSGNRNALLNLNTNE